MKEKTTPEQWERYYADLKSHEQHMDAKKPKEPNPLDYPDEGLFMRAMAAYRTEKSQWDMAYSCDAPNKPGYYRANND